MLLPVLVLLTAATNSMEAGITLRTGAPTVQRLLADLSAKAGVRLHSTGIVAQERVILDVHNIALAELMPRLAKVTAAEWQRDERGGYLLERTPAVRRQYEAKQTAEIEAALREAILLRVKQVERQGTWSSGAALAIVQRVREANRERRPGQPAVLEAKFLLATPGDRLAARLLDSLDPALLARIPEGDRIVFCNRPNASERAFKKDVAPVLSTFADEQRWWLSAMQSESNGREYEIASALGGHAPIYGDTPPPKPGSRWNVDATPDRVLLAVSKYDHDSFRYMVKVADQRGTVIFGNGDGIDPYKLRPKEKTDPAPTAPAVTEGLIKARPLTETFLKVFGTPFLLIDDAEMDLDPALRQMLLQPEKYEPLELAVADLLLGLAAAKHENLIACVPDNWATAVAYWTGEPDKRTPRQLIEELKTWNQMKVDEADGWLQISTVDLTEGRFDRSSLRRFFQNVEAAGNIRLNDLADFAADNEDLPSYASDVLERTAKRTFEYESTDWGYEWDLLRVYSSLSVEQRVAAVSGPIRLADLPPRVLSLIQRHLKGSTYLDDVQTDRMPRTSPPRPETIEALTTQALPNGIPANAWLSIELRSKPVIYGTTEPVPGRKAIWGIEAPQNVLDYLDNPKGSEDFTSKQLAKGVERDIILRIHYTERFYSEAYFSDHEFEQPFLTKNPPSDLRDYARAAINADHPGSPAQAQKGPHSFPGP